MLSLAKGELTFLLVICIAKNFIWSTLKVIFSKKMIYIYILHPQIPDFQIAYLFSFQLMYNSQFQIIDPYDWFCGPWSHLCNDAFHNSDCIERNLHSCTEMHVNIRIGLVSDMNA